MGFEKQSEDSPGWFRQSGDHIDSVCRSERCGLTNIGVS